MHELVWYSLAALIAWAPAAVALRTAGHDRLEQIVGGLLVALAWPFSLPALFVGIVRGERVVATR
jgi:hypothetical protein